MDKEPDRSCSSSWKLRACQTKQSKTEQPPIVSIHLKRYLRGNQINKKISYSKCMPQTELGTVLTGPADHLSDYWKTRADVKIYLLLLANLAI